MKTIFALSVIALILCFFSETYASTGIEEAQCQPGKVWHEGCVRKECAKDGKHINTLSCGTVSCPEGFAYKPGDRSQPYPNCCPSCDVPHSKH